MVSLLQKVAVAGALALSLGAHAGSLGTLSGTTPFSTATTGGSFEDLYQFSVTPNAGTVLASTAVTFSSYGATVSSLALYLGSYTSASQLTGLTPISMVTTASTQSLGGGLASTTVSGATYGLLPGNTYTLVVEGSSKGASAYNTVIALAPVPEPETYAMLLAGLGMMGFIARRRQKKN